MYSQVVKYGLGRHAGQWARAHVWHVGRPSREEMLLQDGPIVLCVLLGTPHGRWRSEFTAPTRAALEARSLLCHALGVTDVLHSASDTFAMVGMIFSELACCA